MRAWQAGIAASSVWALAGSLYWLSQVRSIATAVADFSTKLCREEGRAVADCAEQSAQAFDAALKFNWWALVSFIAPPVIAGWVVAYVLIRIWQWHKARARWVR